MVVVVVSATVVVSGADVVLAATVDDGVDDRAVVGGAVAGALPVAVQPPAHAAATKGTSNVRYRIHGQHYVFGWSSQGVGKQGFPTSVACGPREAD
jgi:hypothetical protein